MNEELRNAQPLEGTVAVEDSITSGGVTVEVASVQPFVRRSDAAQSFSTVGKPDPAAVRFFADFAGSVHQYFNDHIKDVDQNAGFLFAAVTTTLAFLNNKGVTQLWITNPLTWSSEEVLAFLAVMGLLASATALTVVLRPRKKGSRTGLVSWGAVSKCRSAEEYARLVLGTGQDGLTEARLEHCFELSQVCIQKYRAMAWALWSGWVGFVATLIYLALT